MRKLRFVAAAVLMCSWACAGGDEPDSSNGAQPLARQERPGTTSSASAEVADDPDEEVVGGAEQDQTTEGSNTNWMPTEPWLDLQRPPAHARTDPRRPPGGQLSNTSPGPAQGQPSTSPGQESESSSSGSNSSGSSSGSNDSTPSPD
jgi:hypothetical protein